MRLAPLQNLVKKDERQAALLTQAIVDTKQDLYDFVRVTPEDTAAIAKRCKEARNKFHRYVCGACGRRDCRDASYLFVRLDDVGYANDANKAATFKCLRLTSNDAARGVYGNLPSRKQTKVPHNEELADATEVHTTPTKAANARDDSDDDSGDRRGLLQYLRRRRRKRSHAPTSRSCH